VLVTSPRVAVVGSRHAGVEGQRLAEWVARDVVNRGGIVCSGGAIGTDTIAHRAATNRKRPTICVLPSGIDIATPRRNRALFGEISQIGCLVSAYPLGVAARAYHYHDRNALLVSLSDVVIVVRARSKSGSRITAEAALKQGKPLFVVPGSPDDPHALGCLDLIEAGARIYRDGAAVIDAALSETSRAPTKSQSSDAKNTADDVGPERVRATSPASSRERLLDTLSATGRAIVCELSARGGVSTPDAISAALGLTAATVSSELIELELFGLCARPPGGATVELSPAGRRALGR
jgi:DNA processing protein